jgi:hypothetical protein
MGGLVLPTSPASATTTVKYNVVATASNTIFPTVSFAGVALSESRTEFGVWNATFSTDLGAIFDGGTFTFKSKVRTFNDTIAGGTFGEFGLPAGNCSKTAIPLRCHADALRLLEKRLVRRVLLDRGGNSDAHLLTRTGGATEPSGSGARSPSNRVRRRR